MPAATTLSRIPRSEFFAILAPGVYITSVATILFAALATGGEPATATLKHLSENIAANWPLGIILLFFAYLVGNILRTVPVSVVDRIGQRTLYRLPHKGFRRYMYMAPFPYRPMLEALLKGLQKNGLHMDVELPPEGTSHSVYNYWKLEVCRSAQPVFEYQQELEGRVRLFSGMIWASVLSSVSGWVGLVASVPGFSGLAVHHTWAWPMGMLFGISLFFALLLTWRLRDVRAEEVQAVFYGNLILKELAERTNSSNIPFESRHVN